MTSRDATTRLVFVGGGHAHLYSLIHADQFVQKGAEIILIGPDRYHYYSGMGPGMLSRIYRPEQLRFDLPSIVQSRGGTFIKDKVVSVDAEHRTLRLAGGDTVDYDLVSFNVGSKVPTHVIPGAAQEAIPVKPIEKVELLRETILTHLEKGATPRIAVIGGGPAGVEFSANIWRLVTDHRGRADITVLNAADRLVPNVAEKAGRLAEASLSRRGIQVRHRFLVESMGDGTIHSKDGQTLPYDVAVVAIGIVPSPLFKESGLPTAPDGGLLVNDRLQSVMYPTIFGGGDCITIEGQRLDRVGVYAVRQSPVLFQNLMATLTGSPFQPFTPQPHYLLIFNLGDGTGLFVRRSLVWKGSLAFRWKDYIDTRFVKKFQSSEAA